MLFCVYKKVALDVVVVMNVILKFVLSEKSKKKAIVLQNLKAGYISGNVTVSVVITVVEFCLVVVLESVQAVFNISISLATSGKSISEASDTLALSIKSLAIEKVYVLVIVELVVMLKVCAMLLFVLSRILEPVIIVLLGPDNAILFVKLL
jgi:hypothetical protein